MPWNRKRKISGKNTNYSILNSLKEKNLSNDEFEVMINSISLEDLIAMKLELATRAAGGYLYGLPIWKSTKNLVRDALLKYALSATRTKKEASRFLGISILELNLFLKEYKTEKYFEE
jgi:hypothetical protein